MSNMTNSDPIIQDAYAEIQRFYANPETSEKARQRRRFLIDYNLGMSSSRAEGEAKGAARTIIRFLTRRFGVVAPSLEGKLYELMDIDQLDRLFDFAQDCNSLEEIERAI